MKRTFKQIPAQEKATQACPWDGGRTGEDARRRGGRRAQAASRAPGASRAPPVGAMYRRPRSAPQLQAIAAATARQRRGRPASGPPLGARRPALGPPPAALLRPRPSPRRSGLRRALLDIY